MIGPAGTRSSSRRRRTRPIGTIAMRSSMVAVAGLARVFAIGLVALDARAAGPDGRSHDLVVVGGTPAGIACAVRAAREGLSVLLVNRHEHLGGMLSSGLGVWDTQYEGKRAPIYDEVRAAIVEHYRERYGADSPQYRDALVLLWRALE